jgi:hypothetical protein
MNAVVDLSCGAEVRLESIPIVERTDVESSLCRDAD